MGNPNGPYHSHPTGHPDYPGHGGEDRQLSPELSTYTKYERQGGTSELFFGGLGGKDVPVAEYLYHGSPLGPVFLTGAGAGAYNEQFPDANATSLGFARPGFDPTTDAQGVNEAGIDTGRQGGIFTAEKPASIYGYPEGIKGDPQFKEFFGPADPVKQASGQANGRIVSETTGVSATDGAGNNQPLDAFPSQPATQPVQPPQTGNDIIDSFEFGVDYSADKEAELAELLQQGSSVRVNTGMKGGFTIGSFKMPHTRHSPGVSIGTQGLSAEEAKAQAREAFAARFPQQVQEQEDLSTSKAENIGQDIDMLFNKLQRQVGTRTINDYASDPQLMTQLAQVTRDAIQLPEGWETETHPSTGQVTLRKTATATKEDGTTEEWKGQELSQAQQSKLARTMQMHGDAVSMYNDLQASSPGERLQTERLEGEKRGREWQSAENIATRDFQLAERIASQDFTSTQQRDQQYFAEREGIIQRSFQQSQNELSASLERQRINNQVTSIEDIRQVADLQRDLDRERYKAEIIAGQGLKQMDIDAMTAMEDQQFTHKMQMMASETVQVMHREEFIQNKHKEVETALIKARDEGQMDRLEEQIRHDWAALNLEIDSQQVAQAAEHEFKKSLQEQTFQNEYELMDNATRNRLKELQSQHGQDRNQLMMQITEQGRAQGVEISSTEAMALAERTLRREQFGAEIDAELTSVREQITSAEAMQAERLTAEAGMQTEALTAQAQNLAAQIQADAAAQGQQISADAALAQANQQLQSDLQTYQIESQEFMQAAQIAAEAVQQGADREAATQNLASQISAEAQARGETISAENARALADRELQVQLTNLQGTQQAGMQTSAQAAQMAQIGAAAQAEQQTFQFQLQEQEALAARQREALGIVTPQEQIQQAQTVTAGYMQNLNTALSQAATSGDYGMVNDSLAQALPPAPPGIVWDRSSGVFQQRAGFEGRDIDVATQQWIAAVTPAFKARDRAEQATMVAQQVQLDMVAKQQEMDRHRQQFEDDMLTGDIDSAEEANTRMVMAETAAVAIEQKMQHVQMLFNLLQNPVQLAMAKKHGLLGQIESVLGFTMSNVADSGGIDGVPTPNQWQNLDPEQQAFSLANFVEQGGSPDSFLRMIAGAAPAQMQQLQYGVV